PGDETADAISAAVVRVTRAVESGIRTEAIISAFLIALWFFVLLLAILRALTLAWSRDKTHPEGGFYPPTLSANAAATDSAQTSEKSGFHDVPLTDAPTGG